MLQLLFHMAKGKLEGKQLLSENSSSQMQTPQMVIQGERDYPELGDLSYGMGFFIASYRGHKLVEHGGKLDGFSLEFAFLPEDQIGVIVLANLDQSRFRDALPYDVFDRALGLQPLPWNERFLEREQKEAEAENTAEDKGFTGRREGTHPSLLEQFVGDYDFMGRNLSIQISGNNLTAAFPGSPVRPLEPKHGTIFNLPSLPGTTIEFKKDESGKFSQLVFANTDISYLIKRK